MSAGSSASAVPAPTTIASAQARRRCASARASSPVIHRDEPSRAAVLPSSDAATFSVTNGQPGRRRGARTPRSAGRASAAEHAVAHLDARRAQAREARGRRRAGSGRRRADHHARDAGVDQRVGARGGPRRVVAGLQGADDGRAARPVARLAQRAAPRRAACRGPSYHPRPTTSPSRTTTAPTIGLGETRPQPRSARSSARRMCSCRCAVRPSSPRPSIGAWTRRRGAPPRHAAAPRRPSPPIPTLTVGPGIAPGPPPTGCRGVADCHRRWGLRTPPRRRASCEPV